MNETLEKLRRKFESKSPRERFLVIGASLVTIGWISLEGMSVLSGALSADEGGFQTRLEQFQNLQDSLERYSRLAARSTVIERTYAQSQLSTEQVYEEVEKIVKDTVASEGYELRPVGSISDIGTALEQQGYSLKIKQLSLKQIVGLLYKLEQGKAPLFMGKLDISKAPQQGMFSATVELSSLRKKR